MQDRIMKNLLFILLGLFAMVSCDSDDDGGWGKRHAAKNTVTYKISCNNPTAHVKVDFGGNHTPIIIGEWDTTYVTDSYSTGVYVVCLDDPLATVTCQIYVNGKKVSEVSDYRKIETYQKLK